MQRLFPASLPECPALSSENEAGGGELVFRAALENKVCAEVGGVGRTLTIKDTRGPSLNTWETKREPFPATWELAAPVLFLLLRLLSEEIHILMS